MNPENTGGKESGEGMGSAAPPWLKAVEAAATPAAKGRGGLQRLVRRAVARAAWKGGVELHGDQRAFNAAVVDALSQLASEVRQLQGLQRASMRVAESPEGLLEALRVLRSDLEALRGRADGAADTEAPSSASCSGMEAIYRAFEEEFRGSQELIEGRLQVYRPWVAKALEGMSDPLWLDLGCGRGEWLRVLGRQGIRGQGVDGNAGMAAAAQGAGLDVIVGDLLVHLRSRISGSVDGLSAFHVVEHLPPDLVWELLKEGLRVVRPGGALILETPNPENLQVGAHTFYLDPTHRNPVPPAFLAFLARQAGWEQVEVLRLHADEGDLGRAKKAWGKDGALGRVADLMFGPRDYAVLARRPLAG